MTGPAYPAARAAASKAQDHFTRHLSAARERGIPDLAPTPSREAIEAITDAAFWASLRREEGYAPKISLAFLPPEQAGLAMMFEQPLALSPDILTRLAPAVERPGIHLGVWRRGAGESRASFSAGGSGEADGAPPSGTREAEAPAQQLVVWGATRTIPSYCFVLEVVAPGLLVIKHRSAQKSGKFVNVAVLEGDQVKVLDPLGGHLADSPPLLKAVLGLDSLQAADQDGAGEQVNILVQLAVSMRAHGRGGSLLVVPAGSETWRESIVRPISYGVAPPFAALQDLMREAPDEKQQRRWQEGLRRAVDAVAGLTAVDGATIISDRYDLLAFGAKITRREGGTRVERVVWTEPLEGAVARIVAPSQLGGTRHISAAQFAQDQHDANALVASQDGRFTVFAWSAQEQMVHAHRVEALLL
jgi:hypothetical protein